LGEATSLALTLRDLRPLLERDAVTELCINRPGEAFVETSAGWRHERAAFADIEWCTRFSKLVANSTTQRINESSPLLSASLPGGERVQIVIPPATIANCVAITIRRPANSTWTIDDLSNRGIFRHTARAGAGLDPTEEELLRLLSGSNFLAFMKLAVLSRKNILVSGPTGSGKTTWTKALIREIPANERLITIEDAAELALDRHPNHVRLFSKTAIGVLFTNEAGSDSAG
jgi:type IV secretion system protein VirB11